MSHKHFFLEGGHSVTSDIGGGHSERDPKSDLLKNSVTFKNLTIADPLKSW